MINYYCIGLSKIEIQRSDKESLRAHMLCPCCVVAHLLIVIAGFRNYSVSHIFVINLHNNLKKYCFVSFVQLHGEFRKWHSKFIYLMQEENLVPYHKSNFTNKNIYEKTYLRFLPYWLHHCYCFPNIKLIF